MRLEYAQAHTPPVREPITYLGQFRIIMNEQRSTQRVMAEVLKS